MVSAVPARAPSFVLVANPGYYLAGGPPTCTLEGCLAVDPRRPYNQGAPALDLGTAWLAVAGPGVARNRLDSQTWIDQADIRPTLLALVGLRDSYAHDGRVVSEALRQEAEPPGIRESRAAYESVAASLEQLNSPAGRVGLLSLAAATRALRSDSAGDGAYRVYLLRIQGVWERRDAAAGQMLPALEAAAFDGKPLDPRAAAAMVNQADQLITEIGRAWRAGRPQSGWGAMVGLGGGRRPPPPLAEYPRPRLPPRPPSPPGGPPEPSAAAPGPPRTGGGP